MSAVAPKLCHRFAEWIDGWVGERTWRARCGAEVSPDKHDHQRPVDPQFDVQFDAIGPYFQDRFTCPKCIAIEVARKLTE